MTENNEHEKPKLRNCNECGEEVSKDSLVCPHCGHPQGHKLALVLLGVFGLLLMVLFVAFYLFCMCQC